MTPLSVCICTWPSNRSEKGVCEKKSDVIIQRGNFIRLPNSAASAVLLMQNIQNFHTIVPSAIHSGQITDGNSSSQREFGCGSKFNVLIKYICISMVCKALCSPNTMQFTGYIWCKDAKQHCRAHNSTIPENLASFRPHVIKT